MPTNNIELELRAGLERKNIKPLAAGLERLGFRLGSSTRRTSIMHFGHVTRYDKYTSADDDHVDIRCRVTNGRAEVVAKIGPPHGHNRKEISVPVDVKGMVAFGRMFANMGFYSKAGSRLNTNYLKGPVCVTLTQSPSKLAYVELEIMSSREKEDADLEKLRTLARELGITPWTTKQQYYNFCDRLEAQDDWQFTGTDEDVKRLRQEMKRIESARIMIR